MATRNFPAFFLRTVLIAFLWVPLCWSGAAHAEDPGAAPANPHRVFLGVGGALSQGHGQFNDVFTFDRILGKGGGFQVFVGAPLYDYLSLQVAFAMDFHENNAVSLRAAYHDLEMRVFPMPDWTVSPYLVAGMGAALISVERGYGPPPRSDTHARVTYTAGAGADVNLSESVAFLPEIRVRYLRDPDVDLKAYPVDYSLNVLYRFE